MPSDRLVIPEDLYNELVRHTKELYPEEACGILAGTGEFVNRIYRMTNIEHSGVSYLMDSREQFKIMKELRTSGLEMVGIYHSHTMSEAYPSAKDVSLAFYDVAYVIVSLTTQEPVVKAFRIKDQMVQEIPLIIKSA